MPRLSRARYFIVLFHVSSPCRIGRGDDASIRRSATNDNKGENRIKMRRRVEVCFAPIPDVLDLGAISRDRTFIGSVGQWPRKADKGGFRPFVRHRNFGETVTFEWIIG